MNVLLLVEGESDRKSLPILCRKLLPPRQARLKPIRAGRGNLSKPQALINHVKAADSLVEGGIDLVLVFVDSECTPEQQTRQDFAKPIRTLRETRIVERCKLIVVTHALETWLMADRRALQSVLGSRARIEIPGDFAADCRPKEIMKRVFRANGKSFKETVHCPELADAIEPDAIHLDSFEQLRKILSSVTG